MVTAGENQEPWQCDLGPRLTSIFFKTSFQTIAGAGAATRGNTSVTLGLLWSELSPGQLCDPGHISLLILSRKDTRCMHYSTWGSQKHSEKKRMQKRRNMLCNT